MNDKVKKFIKLVQENPELEVISMVDTDVIGDENCSWWYGEIGNSQVRKYITYQLYQDGEQIVFYEDRDDIEEYIKDHDTDYIRTDEEIKKYVEAMEWREVIFLDINTPDNLLK